MAYWGEVRGSSPALTPTGPAHLHPTNRISSIVLPWRDTVPTLPRSKPRTGSWFRWSLSWEAELDPCVFVFLKGNRQPLTSFLLAVKTLLWSVRPCMPLLRDAENQIKVQHIFPASCIPKLQSIGNLISHNSAIRKSSSSVLICYWKDRRRISGWPSWWVTSNSAPSCLCDGNTLLFLMQSYSLEYWVCLTFHMLSF